MITNADPIEHRSPETLPVPSWPTHAVSRLSEAILRLYTQNDLTSFHLTIFKVLSELIDDVTSTMDSASSLDGKLISFTTPHLLRAHLNAATIDRLRGLASEVPPPQQLRDLGLTCREAEVLHWVIQGKRNGEIATILGTKTRTVTKHLERIFQKLGVETRTAAALVALERKALSSLPLDDRAH